MPASDRASSNSEETAAAHHQPSARAHPHPHPTHLPEANLFPLTGRNAPGSVFTVTHTASVSMTPSSHYSSASGSSWSTSSSVVGSTSSWSTSSLASSSAPTTPSSEYPSSSSILPSSSSTTWPEKLVVRCHQSETRIVIKYNDITIFCPKSPSWQDFWTAVYEHFLVRRPDDPGSRRKVEVGWKKRRNGSVSSTASVETGESVASAPAQTDEDERILTEATWPEVGHGDVLRIRTSERSPADVVPSVGPSDGGLSREGSKKKKQNSSGGIWAGFAADGNWVNSPALVGSLSPKGKTPSSPGEGEMEVTVRTLAGDHTTLLVPSTLLVSELLSLYCARTGTTMDGRKLLVGTIGLGMGATLRSAGVRDGSLVTVFP